MDHNKYEDIIKRTNLSSFTFPTLCEPSIHILNKMLKYKTGPQHVAKKYTPEIIKGLK
jgi:hypothetical protein